MISRTRVQSRNTTATMPPSCADAHCCDARPPASPPRGPRRHAPAAPSRRGPLHHESAGGGDHDALLRLAALELSALRGAPGRRDEPARSFPPACLHLLHALLPGNARCHDCRAPAGWADVSHGVALCLACAGRHRGLGVGTSVVKSLALDAWTAREVLCLLEGGNAQLARFFDRHGMGAEGDGAVAGLDRYRTRAASFYRQHLASHARHLAEREGLYEGREASRGNAKGHRAAAPMSPSSRTHKPKRRKSIEPPPSRLLPAVSETELAGPACAVAGA